MSSIASNASGITVSAFGEEEMDFDVAVDKVFGDLQNFVNNTHCEVRQLSMCEERADTYCEALEIWHNLDVNISGALNLFKELKSISKQVLGKPPPAYKEDASKMILKWKNEAKMEKEKEKEERKLAKEESKKDTIK